MHRDVIVSFVNKEMLHYETDKEGENVMAEICGFERGDRDVRGKE